MANQYLELLQEILLIMKEQRLSKKEIMSVDELANYTGMSKSYIYRLTSQRKIPHYKPLNKTIFFKRGEIDKFLLAHPIQTIQELQGDYQRNTPKNGRI